MGYRRGFKSEANSIGAEIRHELGLGDLDPLNPRYLAGLLEIPIHDVSDLAQEHPRLQHLLKVEPAAFSAITVFDGAKRAIVHNDGHHSTRQHSNLTHEISHGLLLHPPTPALDDRGCREWDQNIEDEATWLAGVLLVPETACLDIARTEIPRAEAADQYQVSPQMIQYRLNVTGAMTRVRRMKK